MNITNTDQLYVLDYRRKVINMFLFIFYFKSAIVMPSEQGNVSMSRIKNVSGIDTFNNLPILISMN